MRSLGSARVHPLRGRQSPVRRSQLRRLLAVDRAVLAAENSVGALAPTRDPRRGRPATAWIAFGEPGSQIAHSDRSTLSSSHRSVHYSLRKPLGSLREGHGTAAFDSRSSARHATGSSTGGRPTRLCAPTRAWVVGHAQVGAAYSEGPDRPSRRARVTTRSRAFQPRPVRQRDHRPVRSVSDDDLPNRGRIETQVRERVLGGPSSRQRLIAR